MLWGAILSLLISGSTLSAQHTISGRVLDKERQALLQAQVLLSIQDSLVAVSVVDQHGKFALKQIPTGAYILRISSPGYSDFEAKYQLSRDIKGLEFVLVEEMTDELQELVISADRKRETATGQVYFLSSEAKRSGDPYKALSEIPRLRVNVASQSVRLDDGTSPYILIDGKLVNTGITPINPEDILSVEIVEVVNARFLQMGIKSLLNIKLKPKRNPYQFYQVATRSDVPWRNGFGVGYFEIGNSKVSLYGRGSLGWTYNDDAKSDTWQRDEGYFKSYSGTMRKNKKYLLGELILKWSLTERDYMAVQLYANRSKQSNETWGSGALQINSRRDFEYSSDHHDDSYIYTAGMYYRHDFSRTTVLEAVLGYNLNGNENNGKRQESFGPQVHDNLYEYDNKRASANLDLTLSHQWRGGKSFVIGSTTRSIEDRIEKVSDALPTFRHSRVDEYLYAGYGSRWGKMAYMLSGGLEYVFLRAGDARNHYFKPKLSLSANYAFNRKNSTRLSYKLTNQAPSEGQLNPYNTSTDPLVIIRGNPGLLPQQRHQLDLIQTIGLSSLTLTPKLSYSLFTDMIEPYTFMENKVQVNTFRNAGRFARLYWGSNLSYQIKRGKGNAYLGVGQQVDYFTEQKAKPSILLNAGLWLFLGKWTVGGDISWQDRSYTLHSQTTYLSPVYAQCQVNYNITPNLYLAVALQNFSGAQSQETRSYTGSFNSYHRVRNTDAAFSPWILIRYTIRKNSNKKIKIDNVLKSQEEGIRL